MNAAVDNDLILKAVSYGLEDEFWPQSHEAVLGILGAARYVVTDRIQRHGLRGGPTGAQDRLAALLTRCQEVEPNEVEIALAAELELSGQRLGLALDAGESQLAAIVLNRGVDLLETGDKRAISALEKLRPQLNWLQPLRQRVRCLEQITLRAATEPEGFGACSAAICGEPEVDKSLSVCFGCFGNSPTQRETALDALKQYIDAIRESAPEVLTLEP